MFSLHADVDDLVEGIQHIPADVYDNGIPDDRFRDITNTKYLTVQEQPLGGESGGNHNETDLNAMGLDAEKSASVQQSSSQTISRPRSLGEAPGAGFTFSKPRNPQLDFRGTRRQPPSAEDGMPEAHAGTSDRTANLQDSIPLQARDSHRQGKPVLRATQPKPDVSSSALKSRGDGGLNEGQNVGSGNAFMVPNHDPEADQARLPTEMITVSQTVTTQPTRDGGAPQQHGQAHLQPSQSSQHHSQPPAAPNAATGQQNRRKCKKAQQSQVPSALTTLRKPDSTGDRSSIPSPQTNTARSTLGHAPATPANTNATLLSSSIPDQQGARRHATEPESHGFSGAGGSDVNPEEISTSARKPIDEAGSLAPEAKSEAEVVQEAFHGHNRGKASVRSPNLGASSPHQNSRRGPMSAEPSRQNQATMQVVSRKQQQKPGNPMASRRPPAPKYGHETSSNSNSTQLVNDASFHRISSRNGQTKVAKPRSNSKIQYDSRRSYPNANQDVPTRRTQHGGALAVTPAMAIEVLTWSVGKEEREKAEKASKGAIERLHSTVKDREADLLEVMKEKDDLAIELNKYKAEVQKYSAKVQEYSRKVQKLENFAKGLGNDVDRLNQAKAVIDRTETAVLNETKAGKAEREEMIAQMGMQLKESASMRDNLKQEFDEVLGKLKWADHMKSLREAQLSEKSDLLTEEKTLRAGLEKQLSAALASYDKIAAMLSDHKKSTGKSLGGIFKLLGETHRDQGSKGKIEECLNLIKALQSPSSSQTSGLEKLQDLIKSLTESVHVQTEEAKKTGETTQQAASSLEKRLIDRLLALKDGFKAVETVQSEVAQFRETNAALQGRHSGLQEKLSDLQQQLDASCTREAGLRDNVSSLQDELCRTKATPSAVEPVRFQELQSRLQVAQSELLKEAEKSRIHSEVESALRAEVQTWKEQFEKAEEASTRLRSEKPSDKQISKVINDARSELAKDARELQQAQRAKHENEMHAIRQRARRAEEALETQSAQIAACNQQVTSLRDQIRLKDTELRGLRDATTSDRAKLQELHGHLERANSEDAETQRLYQDLHAATEQLQARDSRVRDLERRIHEFAQAETRQKELEAVLEKSKTDNDNTLRKQQEECNVKLKQCQQLLTAAQNDKNESDSRLDQSRKSSKIMQEELEENNRERDDLREQLRESQAAAIENEHEFEKYKRDVEEEFKKREEQSNADLGESEMNRQRTHEEYEVKLQAVQEEKDSEIRDLKRQFEQERELRESEEQQRTPGIDGRAFRRASEVASARDATPAVETPTPSTNVGVFKKPRRIADRSSNSVRAVGHTFLEADFSSQIQTSQQEPAVPRRISNRGDDSWRTQDLEALPRSLHEPVSFSKFHEDNPDDESRLENRSSTSFSSVLDLDNLSQEETRMEIFRKADSETRNDPQETSYNSGFSGREPTLTSIPERSREARTPIQAQTDGEDPSILFERPRSQANISARVHNKHNDIRSPTGIQTAAPRTPADRYSQSQAAYSTRQKKHGEGLSQSSSPAFMESEPSKSHKPITYGNYMRHTSRTGSGLGRIRSDEQALGEVAPSSSGLKRRASESSNGTSSSKRPRARASSIQRGKTMNSQLSHVSETQSQSKPRSIKSSQSQSQQMSNIPASLMRTSQGPGSSSKNTRGETARRRQSTRLVEQTERFKQELGGR